MRELQKKRKSRNGDKCILWREEQSQSSIFLLDFADGDGSRSTKILKTRIDDSGDKCPENRDESSEPCSDNRASKSAVENDSSRLVGKKRKLLLSELEQSNNTVIKQMPSKRTTVNDNEKSFERWRFLMS